MNVPIDITGDLVSTIDWDVVMKVVTPRVRACRHNSGTLPIITVEYHLHDALLEGWASAYLCTHLPRGGDDLRTKLVRWIAKSLNVDVFTNERRKLSVSQEAVQRLRDTMIERESLIINGFWVRVVSF